MADSVNARRVRILRPRIIAPLLALAFGLGAAVMSVGLSLGSLTEPEPGLWPFIVSTVVVGTAVILLVNDVPSDYERWDGRIVRVGVGIAALAMFIVLFQVLGFLVSAAMFLLMWMWFIGHESWKLAAPLAVCGAIALQILFVIIFGVPFPQGLIEWG